MLPTMIRLASTRAVAELGGRRIVGGMVGRRRPSPFDRERASLGGSPVRVNRTDSPSLRSAAAMGGSAVSAASVISKSDCECSVAAVSRRARALIDPVLRLLARHARHPDTSLDPLPESEAAFDDSDVKLSAPVGGRIKSQVLASEADDFWDNLLRPDETEPNRVLSSVLETTHEGKAAGS
jgi:hypothetical protein